MSTDMSCPVCLEQITAENRGTLVRFTDIRKSPKHKWRSNSTQNVLTCNRCATTPNAGMNGAENLLMVISREFTDDWTRAECTHCALPILLRPSKLRKSSFCSGRCRVAHMRAENKAVQIPVTLECSGCGAEMTGRADRKFCSSACRQKAYRSRNA